MNRAGKARGTFDAAKGFSMGAKSIPRYEGLLRGAGTVGSSGRCIIYNHKTGLVYLSTDNRSLAIEIARTQRERDGEGDYKAYELGGERWCEISGRVDKVKSARGRRPPFFALSLAEGVAFWLLP